MKRNLKKPLFEMDAQELAEATAEFDQEFVADTFGPLTPEMRARWEKARRHLGRSAKRHEAQVVSVSIDRELLARSDALAKKMKISRAGLIARGLKAVLAVEGQI